MPHPKEHPLAHRFVVPHGFTLTGEVVRVIDWLDRCGERMGPEIPARSAVSVRIGRLRFQAAWFGDEPVAADQVVAVLGIRDRGAMLLRSIELPSYDPEPIGMIS